MPQLFKHQQRILDAFPKRHILVWGTGTGKTLAAIALAKKTEEKTLIITPKSLKKNWQEQTNFKVMTKEEFKKLWKSIPRYDCIVVDEAHYFFGTKSALMKSLKGYFKLYNTPYRYFLTATPYRSTPMDIYIMADLLGHAMSYPEFVRRFFYEVRMGHRFIPVPRKGIEEDIADIVRRMGSIVRLEDCVDVPPQVFETEYFELTREQKRALETIPDFLPIVRFTKEHQICGGTLKGDEYNEPQIFASDKFERLKELVEENSRMIVVCRYNHELEYLHKNIENSYVINGEVIGDTRHEIVKSLQKKDRYVLLVNAACSEGWELPECPLMIFYSYDFSLKNYIQMLGRIQRINNIKKNTYLSLIVKDTIDEDVYEAIKRKEDFHIEIYSRK